MENILIHSENIPALKFLIKERKLINSIDLVYIDPPFATGIDFKVSDGRISTISSEKKGNIAYSDSLKGTEFINFLRERLILIRDLLSDEGSIYLHIDYKIGHYVKVMMDEVFGIDNFRNDISRIKCNPKNFNRIGYGNIKDMVLFYSKGKTPIWNEPREEYTSKDIERLFTKKDESGRRYTTVPIHAPGETENGNSSKPFKGLLPPKGRHWRTDIATLEKWDNEGLIEWSCNGNPRKKIFADEKVGKRVQDIWEFKDPQYPSYPTEKNAQMLDLIIRTSSNEDSIVLDCFCGSGTTLRASERLNRKWIGIDRSELAIETTRKNIEQDSKQTSFFGSGINYELIDLSGNIKVNQTII